MKVRFESMISKKTKLSQNMDVFEMKFSKVFPLLIAKSERKGRTRDEVFEITKWLLGYSKEQLEALLNSDVSFENICLRDYLKTASLLIIHEL